jgi:hypothetical protein
MDEIEWLMLTLLESGGLGLGLMRRLDGVGNGIEQWLLVVGYVVELRGLFQVPTCRIRLLNNIHLRWKASSSGHQVTYSSAQTQIPS